MKNQNVQALLFELCQRKFALPLNFVEEILPAVNLIPVPGTSRFAGVIDVRGRVIPVLDLSDWLKLESRPIRYTDHLVIVSSNGKSLAVRVDRAMEIASIEFSEAESQCDGQLAFDMVARHTSELVIKLQPQSLLGLLTETVESASSIG